MFFSPGQMNDRLKITHLTLNSGWPGTMCPSFKATGQFRPQRLLLHRKPEATTMAEDLSRSSSSCKEVEVRSMQSLVFCTYGMERSLNLTWLCATPDCINVGSRFILICLPEEGWNGNALHCHWPKTEHHRLMKKKKKRSHVCKCKLSGCNNNTITKPQIIFYVIFRNNLNKTQHQLHPAYWLTALRSSGLACPSSSSM